MRRTGSDEKVLELLTYDVSTHEFGLRRKKEDSMYRRREDGGKIVLSF